MSLGFTAGASAKTWSTVDNRPMENQNALAEMLTGTRDLFVPLEPATTTEGIEATVTTNGNNAYEMKWPDKSKQAIARVHYDITEEQSVYLDFRPTQLRFIGGNLIVGKARTSFGSSWNTVLDVGRVQPGTRITVELWGSPLFGDPYSFTLIPYGLNLDKYHDVMKALLPGSFQVTRLDDASVSGVVSNVGDGILVMTIPYSTGWKARLDGVAVDTFAFDGGLLAISVPAGTHRVFLRFTPRFFRLGIGLSFFCILLVALGVLRRLGAPGKKEKRLC